MRVLIFTGGECFPNVTIPEYDLCIAADSGYNTAKAAGVFPDLLVGDFDSIGEMPESFTDHKTGKECRVIRHPTMKDETDTVLATTLAREMGGDELYIIGGTGGRADHALSNMILLEALTREGVSVTLCDGNSEICVMTEGRKRHISAGEYRYFSLITTDHCTVSAEGCVYPLEAAELTSMTPSWGVSNEPLEGGATVTCHSGRVFVIRSEKL